MGEVERKVDMLISGIEIPKKKTRSRVVTLATTLIIASVLIASASLINVYYVQTGTVDVTSLITIEDPTGEVHDAGWEESVTIGGIGDPIFYEGTTGISDTYTITYVNLLRDPPDPTIDVYFHITITEELITDTPGTPTGECAGLDVDIYNVEDLVNPINTNGHGQILGFAPGDSVVFEIHVTAMDRINAASTYVYTIKIDWNNPGGP